MYYKYFAYYIDKLLINQKPADLFALIEMNSLYPKFRIARNFTFIASLVGSMILILGIVKFANYILLCTKDYMICVLIYLNSKFSFN